MASSHTTEGGDFVRSRKGRQHINNCKDGYRRPKYCQIHHILCIASMQDPKIQKGDLDYIRKCFGVTKWNINDKDNCIGLPLKKAYKHKPDETGWDKLPCHQIDHNPHYTGGVTKWLNKNVWNKLKKKKADCEVKGKDLADALGKGSTHWKNFLTDRGALHGGTRKCWIHRNDPGMESTWYVPFSMHPGTPPARKPIPDPVPALKKLFKHL